MWIYKNKLLEEIPENAQAFVYKITRLNITEDNESPFYYIGKKNFYSKKKNKVTESDWMDYYGSSDWLTEHVKKYGKKNFQREILEITYSKVEATYKEAKLLIENNVLDIDQTKVQKKLYYNLNIFGKFKSNKFFTKADLKNFNLYRQVSDKQITRIMVNDGKTNIFLNATIIDIEDYLNKNPQYLLGSCMGSVLKNKVLVNNGEFSTFVDQGEVEFFLREHPHYSMGSHLKGQVIRINNGIIERRIKRNHPIPTGWQIGAISKKIASGKIRIINYNLYTTKIIYKSDLDNYLLDGWEICPKDFKVSSFSRWINNGKENKKIKVNEIDKYIYEGWEYGRVNNFNKGYRSVQKDGLVKQVSSEKLEDYLKDGWVLGGVKIGTFKERGLVSVYNIKTNQRKVISKEKVDSFLKLNNDYIIGTPPKNKNWTTEGKVFVINQKTLEKITVTPEEYKNNPDLILRKTYNLKKRQSLGIRELNKINKYYNIIYPNTRKIPTFKLKNKITELVLEDIDYFLKNKKIPILIAPTHQSIRNKKYDIDWKSKVIKV